MTSYRGLFLSVDGVCPDAQQRLVSQLCKWAGDNYIPCTTYVDPQPYPDGPPSGSDPFAELLLRLHRRRLDFSNLLEPALKHLGVVIVQNWHLGLLANYHFNHKLPVQQVETLMRLSLQAYCPAATLVIQPNDQSLDALPKAQASWASKLPTFLINHGRHTRTFPRSLNDADLCESALAYVAELWESNNASDVRRNLPKPRHVKKMREMGLPVGGGNAAS